ncbi:hypothetical protein [Methylosinus sp. Sm6]|uniref:hypothetical protein n=1 Tax=Methylosinus sp. Sm6 TaxID=2866948 RepID=UPI001C996C94|nr:hypothetical protein [Methylosinus sp. Sm6]MBY6242821.1 hypothetical protein [Methylosinus sp. Sm6]
MMRKPRTHRRFTPEEDARLLELRGRYPGCRPEKGVHCANAGGLGAIGKIMGRDPTSLAWRLRKLAGTL